ncbi:3-oxoacyl-ACP reductase FabG [Calidifontibacillus oryziterrae]|uniref:3-oxoacyl-ACP reductase FabG n=1 Tax=Calidifontibacillus oryziterrae TaxID=1191699 RepID=UPI00031FF1B8|nr:3-oxoacyl-ACP reductase FabG [Calidifontibacillus oryziterrae]
MRLQGKVAIVTGGANGLGKQTVLRFAKEGAKVVIADFNEENGQHVLMAVNEQGGSAIFVKVNVADQQSVIRMVETTIEKFGKIDILINNAGITSDGLLAKLSADAWQKVIDVNLTGVFYCTQAVIPHMLEAGKGKIINTSSVSGVYGNVGQTNYAATKAGVVGMTKSWAKELGYKGINVNAVAPGFIETNMTAQVPEKVLQKLVEQIPLRRLGKPEDIANAYLFLASDEANYVNGTVLHVDGGIMM